MRENKYGEIGITLWLLGIEQKLETWTFAIMNTHFVTFTIIHIAGKHRYEYTFLEPNPIRVWELTSQLMVDVCLPNLSSAVCSEEKIFNLAKQFSATVSTSVGVKYAYEDVKMQRQ